ncbi:hypothetical protein [Vibrio splendidus]|uniref:hypothetical protein n=1 Tax=Vibrio splendidus TaxID=29497 RepID=UPI002118C331|nr:hypothetical protein [Vibrio splendidus]MCQ8869738.1 hypothetical protein [Vibrio splendidus]
MNSNIFDPHKSFLSLKIVRGAAIGLLLLAATIAIVIVCNSSLYFSWNYEGFNLFFSVFRFPLSVAALIIPIIALLAANHRSEQTKEQIRVTNEQNVFSNYYKHIEEFNKYLTDRVDKNIDLRFAHHNIYPRASSGDYSISPHLLNLLEYLDDLILDLNHNYPDDLNIRLSFEIRKQYYSIIREIYSFIYRDNQDYSEYLITRSNKNTPDSYLFDAINIIKHSRTAVEKIGTLCKFSIDYVSPTQTLHSEFFNFDEIYVYQKPVSLKGLDLGTDNKEEQTIEEANIRFRKQLITSLQ